MHRFQKIYHSLLVPLSCALQYHMQATIRFGPSGRRRPETLEFGKAEAG
jgi:hypothetical protein